MSQFVLLLVPKSKEIPQLESFFLERGIKISLQPNVSLQQSFGTNYNFYLISGRTCRLLGAKLIGSPRLFELRLLLMREGVSSHAAWDIAQKKLEAEWWALHGNLRLGSPEDDTYNAYQENWENILLDLATCIEVSHIGLIIHTFSGALERDQININHEVEFDLMEIDRDSFISMKEDVFYKFLLQTA